MSAYKLCIRRFQKIPHELYGWQCDGFSHSLCTQNKHTVLYMCTWDWLSTSYDLNASGYSTNISKHYQFHCRFHDVHAGIYHLKQKCMTKTKNGWILGTVFQMKETIFEWSCLLFTTYFLTWPKIPFAIHSISALNKWTEFL